MRRSPRPLLALLAWAALAAPGRAGVAREEGVAGCERLFASHPEDPVAARCFWRQADKPGAARQVRKLLLRFPHNPGLLMCAAALQLLAPAAAEETLRAVADGYSRHQPEGEVLARENLVQLLLAQGRFDEAGREIERERHAASLCKSSSRDWYLALATMSRAWLQFDTGDLERSGLTLDRVPAGPLRDERWLKIASQVHLYTGELERAWDDCVQLAQPAFGHFQRADGLYCQAQVLILRTAELPGDANADRIEGLAKQARLEAVAGGNRRVAALASWPLIMLAKTSQAASSLYQQCLGDAPGDYERSFCRRALLCWSVSAARPNPVKVDDAVRGVDLDDSISRAERFSDSMRVAWRTQPFEVFVQRAQQALSEIEKLRSLQAGPQVQVSLLSTWSDDYYWFAGRLLEAASDGSCPSCLDRAFEVVERLRARALYDTYSLPVIAGSAKSARVSPRVSGFATLSEVQGVIEDDEALLSFQIAPWKDWTGDFGGGSWLIVTTKEMRRVYRLEPLGRSEVRRAVADLSEHRLRPQSWQMWDLYQKLLQPALANLPPGIRKLIVVPDDHLHRLPFAALRATPEGKPIVWSYQISIIPSITLWAHWRSASRAPPADWPALVLADPPPPKPAVQKRFQAEGIQLPVERLPGAGREADALVGSLGSRCKRLVGSEASESAVLDSPEPLRRFALVHFATHSIVDGRDFRRSGIWLAPSGRWDGLLRAADIETLDLGDRLVVLSTCSGNGGPVFRGEGVMSLAHAFFQARARTVVASLWPQLDVDSEALLTAFYPHLSRGGSVAAALRLAQLDLLRNEPNLPLAAWAGMVVLGDGELVPFPSNGRQRMPGWLILAVIGASALSLLALLMVIRRHGTT